MSFVPIGAGRSVLLRDRPVCSITSACPTDMGEHNCIANLKLKLGMNCNADATQLTAVSRYCYDLSNQLLPKKVEAWAPGR